jgi:hypothetical protein
VSRSRRTDASQGRGEWSAGDGARSSRGKDGRLAQERAPAEAAQATGGRGRAPAEERIRPTGKTKRK